MTIWLEDIDCQSAEEFIDNLRLSHPRWKTNSLTSDWIFRGHQDSSWKLIPSAWRPSIRPDIRRFISSSKEFNNILFGWSDVEHPPMGLSQGNLAQWRELPTESKEERIRRFVEQQYFELHLLHDFWSVANNVGHPIAVPDWLRSPIPWSILISPSVGDAKLYFANRLAATAQHHGIPTRLLDWTLFPLTAAYFAATDPIGERIAVWAVHRPSLSYTRLEEFQVPRADLPFLHAQSGLFVWDPLPYIDFANNGDWPAQENVIEECFRLPHVSPRIKAMVAYKITLPKSEAKRVVEMLWHERISKAHLMPTLDSVSEAVLSTFGWRSEQSLFRWP